MRSRMRRTGGRGECGNSLDGRLDIGGTFGLLSRGLLGRFLGVGSPGLDWGWTDRAGPVAAVRWFAGFLVLVCDELREWRL